MVPLAAGRALTPRAATACPRRAARERIERAQQKGAQVERQLEVLQAVRAYLAERGQGRAV